VRLEAFRPSTPDLNLGPRASTARVRGCEPALMVDEAGDQPVDPGGIT
jgi:hypothetical protein